MDFWCYLPTLGNRNKKLCQTWRRYFIPKKPHFYSYLVASCCWLTVCGRVCQVFAGLKPWALHLVCIAYPHLSSCQLSTWLWLDASDHIDSQLPLKILRASMNLRLQVWQEAKFSAPSWIWKSWVTKMCRSTQFYRLLVLIEIASTIKTDKLVIQARVAG